MLSSLPLDERNEQYQILFETMSLGVVYHDTDGRIIDANPAAERIIGLSRDELIGRTSVDPNWRTISEDGSPFPGERHPITVALRTGRPVYDVTMGILNPKTETYTWISINATPQIRLGEQHPYQAYSTFEDVTRRQQAEQEARASREQYHNLVARLEALVAERTAELAAANYRLRMSDQRLQAMFDLSQRAGTLDEQELLLLGIEAATRLTGSQIGYLHFIESDQETIELVTWSESTRQICTAPFDRHYPITQAGIWADTVRMRGPIIHNSYEQIPTRKGYPTGHASIVRHLGVPVVEADKVRLLIGVGNKPTDYDDADVRELLLIGNDLWRIVMRRRAEEALRSSEVRYRTLVESSADALIIIDVGTFQIVDGNHAAIALFGIENQAQLIGLPIDQLSPKHQSDGQPSELLLHTHIQRVLVEGSAVVQWTHCTRQGTPFPALVSLSVLPTDNQSQVQAIVRDISALKRYEAELEQARDLAEAANRAKSSFLANMSHELRTPLNTILGRTELLGEQLYGPLSEPQRVALSSIEESGTHLLALINDVLDLSKIEADQLQIVLEVVDIGEVCQAALRLVGQSAHTKQIQLSLSIDNHVSLIRADGRRLKQILVNLLSNAIKFTPEGGRVGLEVIGDHELQIVTFTVWDSGIGIATEDLERLFKPFVQVDSRLSRQYGGTGLGLALVLRLTELHGGRVAVESQPDIGSRFNIVLPLRTPVVHGKRAEVASSTLAVAARYNPAHPLVLVVEDNLATVQMVRDALLPAGYQVAVANNGVEAISQADKLRPAIILMDIQMPVLDGLEAIRQIRAIPDLGATPIIALTALTMSGDRERCMAAGANAYLPKPVRLRELMELIAAQLDKVTG